MSDSGRPDLQPDFLTGAFNTLKGFGQGVQDFLGAASQAPVVGGALQGLGTVGNVAITPFGLPTLLDEGSRQAALRNYRTLEGGAPGVFDVPAVARAVSAGREQFAGEAGQIAGNQNEQFPARAIAAAAQFATGALPNVAPIPLLPRVGKARVAPSELNAASRIEGGLANRIGAKPGGLGAGQAFADVGARQQAAVSSLAQEVAQRSSGRIGSRMGELQAQGLTDAQAFNAVQHQFGPEAAQRWATTGNDIVVQTPIGLADRTNPAALLQLKAARASASGELRPTVSPKMGSGAPRENLGVNPDKINAPAATVDYIKQVAEDNKGFEVQRRGVVTIAETQEAANKVSIDAQKYSYIQPGTAMNAENLKATFDAMVTKGNEVTALQEALKAERAAGVVSKTTELRALSAAIEHQTLQRVFAGGRAESGRALRIQREIANGMRSGDVNATYNRAVEALGGKDVADALLGRLQDIWTNPKLTPAQREVAVYRFIQNLDKASTVEKIHEYWTNAILSSPSTHIVNVTGQTLLQVADMGTNFLTAAVEAVSSGFGKVRPREYTFSAAFGSFGSLGRGFRQAVVNLKDADAIAATKFRETGKISGQAIGGPVGNIVNLPTKFLGAEDAVFRGIGEARGLYEGAYNVAAREGIKPFTSAFAKRVAELIDNPTEDIVAHMNELGKRAGLRQDAGSTSQALLKLRQNVHIGPVQPLRFVIPFITTPVNLLKVGAEYSPFGFARAISKNGAARSESIARAMLGSAAMGYFAQEFAAGNVTAGAPQNPAEKDAFYAQGKIPYAVRIGGSWYAFSRLEPVATPLKWTAALMQTAKESEGKSWDVTAGKMVFALARYLEDSTYLQGLSDLIDALQDPNKATSFIENVATGFNPAIVRRVTQANDPYIRDPRNMLEQIEATLPYFNEQVPVRQTAFGEPAKRTEGKQGISGVISPVDYNPEQNDPLLQKVASYSLPESIGPDGQLLPVRGLTVGMVSNDIATFGLSADEGARYQQYAGQATRNMLDKLFADNILYDGKKFSTLIYEDQVRAIRKTISDARDVGRAQVADEIVDAATNDGQVARGAIMRLSVLSKLRDEARYVEGLARTGALTPQVRALIDQRRSKDKPTVAEYVRYAPLIDEYANLPKYRIGDSAEWDRLAQVKRQADDFAKQTNKPDYVDTWRWYANVDPEGAQLIRKYSRQVLRDPRRLALLKRYPELERYVSGA